MADFLSNLFGGGATSEAANANRAGSMDTYLRSLGFLDSGYQNSIGALGDARVGATQALGQAGAAYDPLAALGMKYGAATTLGLDALGANGVAGNDRATAAFRAAPGYQFNRDQGLEAVNRRRSIAGGWDSGNTDIDLLKFSSGLADQEYGNWLSRLLGFTNPELAATSGAASGKAGAATNLAGVETGYGNNLNNLYQGDASNRVNLIGSLNSSNMAANNAEAAAKTAGAKNLLGAGLSLASLAAGVPGGGFGFGGGGPGQQPSTLSNLSSQWFGNGTGYQTNPSSKGGMFG